jgi:hypothetical protein
MQAALDEISDQGLLSHGYVDYIRDYEVRILAEADSRTGVPPTDVRWLFKYCVQAEAISALSGKTWCASLDERLLDPGNIPATRTSGTRGGKPCGAHASFPTQREPGRGTRRSASRSTRSA